MRYEVDVLGGAGGTEIITIDFSILPVTDPKTEKPIYLVVEGRNITGNSSVCGKRSLIFSSKQLNQCCQC